jgi:hypothetical protein
MTMLANPGSPQVEPAADQDTTAADRASGVTGSVSVSRTRQDLVAK